MSGLDSNPFADPVDVNPFQVSVVSVSRRWKVKIERDTLLQKKDKKPVWLVAGFGLSVS